MLTPYPLSVVGVHQISSLAKWGSCFKHLYSSVDTGSLVLTSLNELEGVRAGSDIQQPAPGFARDSLVTALDA